MKTFYLLKNDSHRDLPLKREADDIMEREDFREYVSVHGYHFSPKLAEYASHHLTNVDGTTHSWTVDQVRAAIDSLGHHNTCGDVAYYANWLYSDFYPNLLKTEQEVIKAVKEMVSDPDGYDGMVFMRYLSDLIGKGQVIEWLNFI